MEMMKEDLELAITMEAMALQAEQACKWMITAAKARRLLQLQGDEEALEELGQQVGHFLVNLNPKIMPLMISSLALVTATLGEKLADLRGADTYTTGTGQMLEGVHAKDDCQGWCVIHRPIPGPWKDWPTNWRGDQAVNVGGFEIPVDIWRGFERICLHGIGHTAMEEILRGNDHPHGCDGCCVAQEVRDEAGILVGFE